MNFSIASYRLRPLISNSILRNISTRQEYSLKWRTWSRISQLPLKEHVLSRSYSTNYSSPLLDSKKDETHANVWVLERTFSLGSISSTVCMFLYPGENTELFWVFVLCAHVYWGVDAILLDYLRPAVVGNILSNYSAIFSVMISGIIMGLLGWTAVYGNGILRSMQQLWYLDVTKNPYSVDNELQD